MGKFPYMPQQTKVKVKGEEIELELYRNREFKKFNPGVLGLGDIRLPPRQTDAIAAVFDLSGFTKFCTQVDPHLYVPEYLSQFLDWLFQTIADQCTKKTYRAGRLLRVKLPFLAKFTGDGVLFLWDSEKMNEIDLCNVVVVLRNICMRYRRDFIPRIKKEIGEPPPSLKCGIAHGSVLSVGNGDDYVGPCINIASRLQKLSRLTFCFSRRGLDFERGMKEETASHYVVKSVSIRGIGEHELVCIQKNAFERLPQREKAIFREV